MSKRAADASSADGNPAPEKKADTKAPDLTSCIPVQWMCCLPPKEVKPLLQKKDDDDSKLCAHGEEEAICVACITKRIKEQEKIEEEAQKERHALQIQMDAAKNRKKSPWIRHRCDGCHKHNPKGPRYVCTGCTDRDFCQECVDKDVHIEHALIQLKYKHQEIGRIRQATWGDGGWGALR